MLFARKKVYPMTDTGECRCTACRKTNCGRECSMCGMPFCSDECMVGCEVHEAVCSSLHSDHNVGISITPNNMLNIVTPARELKPEMFSTEGIGEGKFRHTNAQRVLQVDINDWAKKNLPETPVKAYGSHLGEIGTGSKFVSKAEAMAVPLHIEWFNNQVAVIFIVRRGPFPASPTDQVSMNKAYSGALEHILEHPAVVHKLIQYAAKNKKPATAAAAATTPAAAPAAATEATPLIPAKP